MADVPATSTFEVPGNILGDFKKVQYLGHMEGQLTKDTQRARMKEIHDLAFKAMHHVHKEHKHRHPGFAKCYVSTTGIFLFEAAEKVNATATQTWAKEAKDIYCVVMGKRKALFRNNLACIMRFADPTKKPTLPVTVDCAVIEFYHDRKNQAAQFHKSCEEMMKALLYSEMAKLDINKEGGSESGEPSEVAPGYLDVPEPVAGSGEEVAPGYMDVPEPIVAVGKKARKSIDASLSADDDYMCVIAGHDVLDDRLGDDDDGLSLADVLARVGDDDEDEEEL